MADPIQGKVDFTDTNGEPRLHVDPDAADLFLGGGNQGGSVVLMNGAGQDTIRLEGSAADLFLGGGNQAGTVVLRNGAGKDTIRIEGGAADLFLGGADQGGTVVLRDGTGNDMVRLEGGTADLFLGGGNQGGTVVLRNGAGKDTMLLDGQTGDINLLNADCAEDFDVASATDAEPGTVMVFDREGRLQPSRDAYDRKVAGVISGAGDYKPGIVLDRGRQDAVNRRPVALMGKAYCKVDAEYAAIEIGDLLTTSPTEGHAMKALDPMRAVGAIIGKAMQALPGGKGLIPILVALQ